MWPGGGQVVSVLAFYSDNPSSTPAEVYNFIVKIVAENDQKINKKRPGLAHLKTFVALRLYNVISLKVRLPNRAHVKPLLKIFLPTTFYANDFQWMVIHLPLPFNFLIIFFQN